MEDQGDSHNERILKKMEKCFSTTFEDDRQERSLNLLLPLTDPDTLKQSKSTDHEITIIKNLALEKLYRQGN